MFKVQKCVPFTAQIGADGMFNDKCTSDLANKLLFSVLYWLKKSQWSINKVIYYLLVRIDH